MAPVHDKSVTQALKYPSKNTFVITKVIPAQCYFIFRGFFFLKGNT